MNDARRSTMTIPDKAYASALEHQRAGRLSEAIDGYGDILRVRPDFAEAHYNLGLSLLYSDREAEAEAALRRAIELEPANANAWNTLGNALRKLGRPYDAVEAYQKAIALRPDFADAHNN